jgi:hypothetical protein
LTPITGNLNDQYFESRQIAIEEEEEEEEEEKQGEEERKRTCMTRDCLFFKRRHTCR